LLKNENETSNKNKNKLDAISLNEYHLSCDNDLNENKNDKKSITVDIKGDKDYSLLS